MRNHTVVFGELERATGARTTAEWVSAFRQADIPAMPIQTLQQLPDDPQLKASGLWHDAEHPTEGTLRFPGVPFTLSATPGGVQRLAPSLGEHTDEVLGEFGFEREAVDALVSAGVVARA
ncbi:Formyl-CoA:oxalate CoA-transferase [compost metagenome]